MMSQYPVTVFVGALIDRHGPALCTLLGGLLFVAGFGSFAHEVAGAPGGPPPSRAAFYRLVAAFLFVGLGTVFSCVHSSLPFRLSKRPAEGTAPRSSPRPSTSPGTSASRRAR